MNPGPLDEVGKAASSAIDALKSTPVVLALVIFNVIYMVGTFWTQARIADTYDRAAERWKTMAEMTLRACNTPTP